MKRLTETGKWDDNFFMSLPPLAKLLITYLHDSCGPEGFADINYPLIQTHTGLTKQEIKDNLVYIKPLVLSDKKSKLWIKHFLYLQNQLPLHQTITEHTFIIEKLKRNLSAFNNAPEIQEILDNIVYPLSDKKKGKFRNHEKLQETPDVADNPPTLEEWKEEYLKQYPKATDGQIEKHYGNCVSKNWITGHGKKSNPMKNWKGAIRTGIGNIKTDAEEKESGQKKSRTQTTISLANKL